MNFYNERGAFIKFGLFLGEAFSRGAYFCTHETVGWLYCSGSENVNPPLPVHKRRGFVYLHHHAVRRTGIVREWST